MRKRRKQRCRSVQEATRSTWRNVRENVVQGATDRREQREVPSSFDKQQSEEELKRVDHRGWKRADPQRVRRADPRRVRRADPQRVRSSQIERDDEHSTEPAPTLQRRPQSRSSGLLARHWRTGSRVPSCATREARTRRTSETSLLRREKRSDPRCRQQQPRRG